MLPYKEAEPLEQSYVAVFGSGGTPDEKNGLGACASTLTMPTIVSLFEAAIFHPNRSEARTPCPFPRSAVKDGMSVTFLEIFWVCDIRRVCSDDVPLTFSGTSVSASRAASETLDRELPTVETKFTIVACESKKVAETLTVDAENVSEPTDGTAVPSTSLDCSSCSENADPPETAIETSIRGSAPVMTALAFEERPKVLLPGP